MRKLGLVVVLTTLLDQGEEIRCRVSRESAIGKGCGVNVNFLFSPAGS